MLKSHKAIKTLEKVMSKEKALSKKKKKKNALFLFVILFRLILSLYFHSLLIHFYMFADTHVSKSMQY